MIHLRYRLDLSELLELNRSSRYQRAKGFIAALAGVIVWALSLWMVLFQDDGPNDPSDGFVWGGIFILFGLACPTIAGFGAWSLGYAPDITLEVSEGGIQYSDRKGKMWIPWQLFTRSYTTRALLVLELGWSNAIAVPKRCCDPAIWTELLLLARPSVIRKNKGWLIYQSQSSELET